jgi:IS5 family transposase
VPRSLDEVLAWFFADAGYTGADKRSELEDCDVDWNIAVKRSIIKALPKALRDWAEAVESALSQVRAWVEHPFHIVKNENGGGKVSHGSGGIVPLPAE